MRERPFVRLEGWNHVPRGYGASFDVPAAPLWLRLLFRTPFLDRFAHPLLVRRGHGYLTPFPAEPAEGRAAVGQGWKLRSPDFVPPGSRAELEPDDLL